MRRLIALVSVAALMTVGASCQSSAESSGQPATKPSGARPAPAAVPLVAVPNPLSGENPTHPLVVLPLPQVGRAVTDGRFKTKLTRLTQRPKIRHEYSRYDPYNRDGSRIVLHDTDSGDLHVYRTGRLPLDRKDNLLKTVDMEQPRWDPRDPNVLWGLRDFKIITVTFPAGKTTVVKDFTKDPTIAPVLKAEPDLYRITTRDEGEASRDMRTWALILQGSKDDYRHRYILTWDRQADRVLGVYKLAANEEIDWVGMSWSGRHVLIGGDSGAGRASGLCMADLALKKIHRLDHTTSHSDVGVDVKGNDVIVMQNSRTDHVDLIPLSDKTRPCREEGDQYAGTNRTKLLRLFYNSESSHGLNSGLHVSCNAPGYAVISTFMDQGVKEQNWLDRCIVLVRLDPAKPKVWYLAKLHTTHKAYWEEPHAVITNDGSKVLWATNWNRNVGQDKVFVMRLSLPPAWTGRRPKSPGR